MGAFGAGNATPYETGFDDSDRPDDPTPLECLQEHIREHGVPEVDRRPQPWWINGGPDWPVACFECEGTGDSDDPLYGYCRGCGGTGYI